MKIENQPLHAKPEQKKNQILSVAIAFFVISLFITIVNLQSFSIVPLWLNISFVILLIGSIGHFGYGLFISKKLGNWNKIGYFILVYLMLISIQLLLTSNTMYIVGVEDGQINEEVNYLTLTLLLYIAVFIILCFCSFIISSPQWRQVSSGKAYVMGSIIAIGIIVLIMTGLVLYRESAFINPDSVKSAYQFFLGAVLALFPATELGVSMTRAKLGGSKR
ncbi:hypothetical protein [Aquibacillus kalidii]|uniref:hypothetical protein n=1 Tax=Aquibacillus kalidii TaxID=2762597 RepID=UPI001647A3F8|nr:hypothetical protein [Aquibacillus kalidii]